MKNLFLSFLFTFLLIVTGVSAQSKSQTKISGTVKDQNASVVAGARVFLLNKQTRMEKYTVSDANGSFSFENLTPNEYEIRVVAEGFAVGNQTVNVSSNENNGVEITLAVGESRITVTAETGGVEETQNVPQAVNIINTNEIMQRTASVLSNVAKEEAGLNVQQTSPTIGAIVVRGLTGKNVVNYVDGVRYTTGAQRGGINTFFNLNDPSNFQTIEVLRGPNGAQYGSDSLGGTVNLLTKSPVFGEKNEFHGEIMPSFNTADRSFGSSVLLSYGTNKLGGYVNIFGRRVNDLRTANGLDSHSAITRFLGLPSDVLYERNPKTGFTQYGGALRLNYAPTDDQQISFFYQRGQQDEGKRFDQLLGGDGNLLADLRNLMLDFGYLRYVKQNFGFFDSASFTVSYNTQREERVNQGGQGNPFGDIAHQYERTSATGFSFFVDKALSCNQQGSEQVKEAPPLHSADSVAARRTGALLVLLQFVLIGILALLAVRGALLRTPPWFAWATAAAGIALGLWAVSANRPGNFNIRPLPRAGGRLVTAGPYRYIRHPMYSAVMLCAIAAALASGSTAGWLASAALFAVLAIKATLEERWMVRAHPDYAGYCAGRRKFLPGVF